MRGGKLRSEGKIAVCERWCSPRPRDGAGGGALSAASPMPMSEESEEMFFVGGRQERDESEVGMANNGVPIRGSWARIPSV